MRRIILCVALCCALPAFAQSDVDRCQQGSCYGYRPPQGISQNGMIYRDLSTTPPTLYCGQAGGWGVCSGGGSGAVASVSNSDGTVTVSPTTGAVVVSLNLARTNIWTVSQTLAGLTLSGVTGATAQCLHASTTGVVSGTGADCSGGGTVSGQANGVIPLATAATAITAQSHLTDNGTTVGSSLPVTVNASGSSAISTTVASNTDLAGQLTLVAGTISLTFVNTYISAPICTATDTTAANAVKAAVTTTTLTLTGTGTDVINYICIGRN